MLSIVKGRTRIDEIINNNDADNDHDHDDNDNDDDADNNDDNAAYICET